MSLLAPLRSRVSLPSTSLPTLGRRTLLTPPTSSPQPDSHLPSFARSSQAEGYSQPGLRMILFGKPGSGKGTLSQRVLENFKGVSLISVGDVLRKEIAAESEVGKKAKDLVAKGEFVSDEIMLDIAMTALPPTLDHSSSSLPSSWILDGFPRTVAQGRMLDERLAKQGRPLNKIVNLGVSDGTILKRISDRSIHIPSGRVYNDTYNPPKTPGKDDITGEALSKRPDDNPETFRRRLDLYNDNTFPLLKYYGDSAPSIVHILKGETSDEIWPELDEVIKEVMGEHTA